MNSILTSKWTKVLVFLICLVPLGVLIWEAFTGGLGSNPTQFLEHATGDWTLRFRGHHAVHYAAAQNSSAAAIDPFPAHAGAVRVFLRMLPFQRVPDV